MTHAIKITRYDGEVFVMNPTSEEQGARDVKILREMGHNAELVLI